MQTTLMIQNLPLAWVTRDLVAWLGRLSYYVGGLAGRVHYLAFCVFEGNLAGNCWADFGGLGGRWGL